MHKKNTKQFVMTEELKNNTISFFKNKSTDQIVNDINWYEDEIARQLKSKKPYKTESDKRYVELLYCVLDDRGFFN